MKKLRFLAFGMVLLIACVFNGCSDNELASVPFELLSMDEKRAYVKNEYKPIAQALTVMANDPEFRSILYQEIEKKFDGDYNVLIENLVNLKTASDKTLLEVMEAKIGEGSLNKALAMFKNLEGQAWYPQIFIPSYDVLKKNELLQGRGHGSNKPVPIILYDGDETKTVVNGYLPNENGELVESVYGIDEQYAMENEVWVISLNESGISPSQASHARIASEIGGSSRTAANEPAKIGRMRVKCHKEAWVAGASEINILTIFVAELWNDYWRISYYDGDTYQGHKIDEFSRGTVSSENWKSVYFDLGPYWNAEASYSDNVIFEYDAWPTGTRTASWEHVDGTPVNLSFRSSDSPYTVDVVYRPAFATTYVNKGCMEWKGIP